LEDTSSFVVAELGVMSGCGADFPTKPNMSATVLALRCEIKAEDREASVSDRMLYGSHNFRYIHQVTRLLSPSITSSVV
jgi:hypothetical protein